MSRVGGAEMFPRQQSAGTAGIVAGVSLAVLFILFFTSGVTPEMLGDPGKALPYISQNLGRLRITLVFSFIALIAAVIFLPGLAAKLRERTPTRATGVLYFGLLGIIGHALGTLVFWVAVPGVAAYAAKDQVAASSAWVALSALDRAFDSFGSFFIGVSTLVAGWAITSGGAMSAALGWFGILTGVVAGLSGLAANEILMVGSFVLPVIWLIWAGSVLRKAM